MTHEMTADIKRKAEADRLRRELATLLESIEQMQTHDRDLLFARYHEQLGILEYSLLCLQVEVLALKKRIDLVQRLHNRGDPIDLAALTRIEAAVEEDLQIWRGRIQAQENQIVNSRLLLGNLVAISENEARRVKSLYRKLARLLHPDVSPENVVLFERHWNTIQSAYENWDGDLLEALLHCVEGECQQSCIAAVPDEVARLHLLLKTQTERLAQLQAEPPFCFARLLDDPAWLASQRASLEASIGAQSQRLAQLQAVFAHLCDGMEE